MDVGWVILIAAFAFIAGAVVAIICLLFGYMLAKGAFDERDKEVKLNVHSPKKSFTGLRDERKNADSGPIPGGSVP